MKKNVNKTKHIRKSEFLNFNLAKKKKMNVIETVGNDNSDFNTVIQKTLQL